MKSFTKLAITIVMLSLYTNLVWAKIGNEGSGGGDPCENRIQVIRDDIKSWIKNGGPKNGLKLSAGLSVTQYSQEMLGSIESAKIKCVKPGDEGFPVAIHGTPKVCDFLKGPKGSQITCDYASFLDSNTMNESDQYVLVHHEFAGLAGLEQPNEDVSTYKISNQISAYLLDVVVKKLAVSPQKNGEPTSPFLLQELDHKALACEPADHRKENDPHYRGDDGYFTVSTTKNGVVEISDNGGMGYGFANGYVISVTSSVSTLFLTVGDDGNQTLQFDFSNIGADSALPNNCGSGLLVSQPDTNDYSSDKLVCCFK